MRRMIFNMKTNSGGPLSPTPMAFATASPAPASPPPAFVAGAGPAAAAAAKGAAPSNPFLAVNPLQKPGAAALFRGGGGGGGGGK